MSFKWYEIVNGSDITQGDIILDCPVLKPVEIDTSKSSVKGNVEIIDAIIMTQACDIENDKVEDVILCNLVDVVEEKSIGMGRIKEIKSGKQPSYHLISKSDVEELNMNYKIVDFKNIYSLPINAVKDVAQKSGNRLRLRSPYREHLSQAFARVFMRVGLPNDIDVKDIKSMRENDK